MAERDEPVALGAAGGLVGDDDGLLEVAEGGEDGPERVGVGLPAEPPHEELAEGRVPVGGGAHGVEGHPRGERGGGGDVGELVPGERLDEAEEVVGVRPSAAAPRPGRRPRPPVLVGLALLGVGIHGGGGGKTLARAWRRGEKRRRRRREGGKDSDSTRVGLGWDRSRGFIGSGRQPQDFWTRASVVSKPDASMTCLKKEL